MGERYPCLVLLTVHAASDLQEWNSTGRCDPQAVVTLWDPDFQSFTTSPATDTRSPVWNYSREVVLDNVHDPVPRVHLLVEDEDEGFCAVLGECVLELPLQLLDELPHWFYLQKFRGTPSTSHFTTSIS